MKRDRAVISVIIPCFNRIGFVADAIHSVFNQSIGSESLELIIVDDGSTDGSWEFLESKQRSGEIVLLCHPGRVNKGQAAALNLGLTRAKGTYIALLDSDDVFAAGKLEDQVAFLDSNPDIGMVYGQGHAIDAEGNYLFKLLPDEHEEPSDPNHLLLDCYMALPGGGLVRRTTWEKAGYFEESFRAAQDHDMALRLMEVAPVAYLPKVAFYYRKHDDAISKKGLERRWKTGFEILERARRRYPYRQSTIRKRAAVLNFRLGQTYWRDGKRLCAVPYFLKSGVLDPVRAVGVLTGREALH